MTTNGEPFSKARSNGPDLPCTPGMDGAGRIDAIGPGAESFSVGDRVYCAGSLSGTYADWERI